MTEGTKTAESSRGRLRAIGVWVGPPGCCIQTGDQVTGQFRPLVLRQGQGLLQQLMGFLGHIQDYTQ